MKPSRVLAFFVAASAASATSLPEDGALDRLDTLGVRVPSADILAPEHALEKRKGGGGKGGGGGGGKGGGNGGGGGSSGRSSSTSNLGGSTRQGSGAARGFGRNRFYGGGASIPHKAGDKTQKALVAGAVLTVAAVLVLFPGYWAFGGYPYYYNNPYRFYNESFHNATQQGLNDTLPVVCLCEEYHVCGCDENDDQSYLNDLIGNGSYAALNKTLVTVSEVNDTHTRALVINGTLPNGTTAPGGDEDAEGAARRFADALPLGRFTGYYAVGVLAVYAAVLL